MSRLIVKGLPREIKEEKLKSTFAAQGEITDIQLKYSKAGVFRRFAFIGYRTEKEAQRAVKFFDRSFIDSSRLQVEIAKDLGDGNLARPWSKYSEKSSAFQDAAAKKEAKKEARKAEREHVKNIKDKSAKGAVVNDDKQKKKQTSDLQELEEEPEFQEFIEAHKGRAQKAVWGNDASVPGTKQLSQKLKVTESKVTAKKESEEEDSDEDESEEEEEDSDDEDEDMEEEEEKEIDEEASKNQLANNTTMSDMDYLKSKIVNTKTDSPDDAEDSSDESDSDDDDNSSSDSVSDDDSEDDDSEDADSGKGSTSEGDDSDSTSENEETNARTKNSSSSTKQTAKETLDNTSSGSKVTSGSLLQVVPKGKSVVKGKFSVKMRGVPYDTNEKSIVKFFHPLNIEAIRIPLYESGQQKGIAFVDFESEEILEEAMRRHKNYMGKRYVELFRDQPSDKAPSVSYQDSPPPWAKQAAELENAGELIADTGRLFVRNLAYICREEDLESLFNKYGPLTETHLPVDPQTRKIKGFAFITFMMPEHAVKAFTELDGTTFQGRLLHILPGKEKKTEEENFSGEGSSYKNQKKAKEKALASSSHNWNSLFISANAVADAMAERYQTTKGKILDADSNRSLAVRMALGETQIVAETRQFLLDNGVALDSFSQPSEKRSKTVILAKNLPAGTKAEELRALFDKHGNLGRVILPPAGVTAIIEYVEPTEARSAFFRLAYTKFQHVPLYLEWAPGNVFGEYSRQEKDQEMETNQTEKESTTDAVTKSSGDSEKTTNSVTADDNDEEDEGPVPGCTIFIKNLNFSTTEETLKKTFAKCGPLRKSTVSKKKDPKNPGQLLSMGYGFVEYKNIESAKKAVKNLQHCDIDGHTIEIKVSNRASLQTQPSSARKQAKKTKQLSTKILVRNIPFEASHGEVMELFSTFGEIKAVRLPKKMSGTGKHRGFGFVDYLSKQDAKRAFDALCHSSHLYGRRLVLEWAETEEDIDTLRQKTAEHFSEDGPAKRFKKSHLLDDLKTRLPSQQRLDVDVI